MSILKRWYSLFGSAIMAAGWGWYHFSKHPKELFGAKVVALFAVIYILFIVGKIVFVRLARVFSRHQFWSTTFAGFLDELWLVLALLFGLFFFRSELWSICYVSVVWLVLWKRTNHYLAHHREAPGWREVNRSVFLLGFFLFIVNAVVQYSAYHYYILDSNIRFFNIVLFRAVAMTLAWLFGFVLASAWYLRFRGAARYVVVVLWSLLYALFLGFWVVNVGILYYSGLYFSPIALEHTADAGGVVGASIIWYLIAAAVATFVLFVFAVHKVFRVHTSGHAPYWRWYQGAIGVAALVAAVSLTSFWNTPEHEVLSSFYTYYQGTEVQTTIDPAILQKLKKFGLSYEPNNFFVNSREQVYSPSSTMQFLPARFAKKVPNVVVVFLESFSSRLTDVYSDKFPGVTPNFLEFSKDPHTTIFKNYYNASTPTITGTLSQLCSFLPPTGHNEIQNDGKLQSHRLLCLPEVLKKQKGFLYANYITAVDKEFAHKDGIFTGAGIDEVLGTAELAKRISGEPLSWGYSDHQMFPELFKEMTAKASAGAEPFFMSLATVDTHPPFNLAKDAVNYGDGSRPVLNSFHTTDDAFGKFWQEFKSSPFYNNTIVITVADHAIFPAALTKDLFPEIASQLTYYDQNLFMMYVPDGLLPKTVETYSSGIDVTPTLLQVLGVNITNSFEGHSIFDDRAAYPNLLGMHELGLYVNMATASGKRTVLYDLPNEISCNKGYVPSSTTAFTECDYLQFYNWKRQMFEEGRFWKH